MNARTAKLLEHYASMKRYTLADVKKWWHSLSDQQKAEAREQMEKEYNITKAMARGMMKKMEEKKESEDGQQSVEESD